MLLFYQQIYRFKKGKVMKQFVRRDFTRTEHDDYVLNVQPLEGKFNESLPVYSEDEKIVGWLIQSRYE